MAMQIARHENDNQEIRAIFSYLGRGKRDSTYQKNVFGAPMKLCSLKPKTGENLSFVPSSLSVLLKRKSS